jgi:RimJ/RimL family protein N-acetyltransferase
MISNIGVRDLTRDDIPLVVDYWYAASEAFLDSMCIDPAKLPKRAELEVAMARNASLVERGGASRSTVLVVTCDQRPVGIHSANDVVPGATASFHAHIWHPELRGRGIAQVSYPAAWRVFFDRFDLQSMMFKTAASNQRSVGALQNLGLSFVGEEETSDGVLRDHTVVRVYVLTREQLMRRATHGSIDLRRRGENTWA